MIGKEQSEYYREVLFSGGLTMYCQPIVSMETGQMVKVELLARLRLPDGTIVTPNRFLPSLTNEEMDKLFQLTITQATQYLVTWKKQNLEIDVTVNLPPITLSHPNCLQWIEETIIKYQIDPRRITLELLETHEIHEETTHHLIARLKNLGVKLALDDLGSGYSSILQLSRLPFDVIKLDQALLANVANEPLYTFGLIYGLIQIGKTLGKEVVVEGVEHLGVMEAIKFFKASMCQGYGLGRPMPFGEVIPWNDRWSTMLWDDEIHTFTGALIFHWLLIHQEIPFLTDTYEGCKLQRFLTHMGKTSKEETKWHIELHKNINFQENLKIGLDYLLTYAINELNGK